jgi:hypothetical protein
MLRHGIIRIGGINADRVGQIPDSDAAACQVVDEVQGVPEGAAQPVQGVHHNHVPLAGLVEGFTKSGTVCGGPGFFVQIDVPGGDAFAAQCIDLSVEVLFRGRDAGVTRPVPSRRDKEQLTSFFEVVCITALGFSGLCRRV